jgi:hypothetical protein
VPPRATWPAAGSLAACRAACAAASAPPARRLQGTKQAAQQAVDGHS